MSKIGRMVERALSDGINRGLEQAAPNLVDACLDALWSHPWFPFIAGGQVRLMEAGMKPREAWNLSRKVLLQWVKDERTEFGAPGYGWDAAGGREIVEECEIQYWDAAK
jgi:hypothetical protein